MSFNIEIAFSEPKLNRNANNPLSSDENLRAMVERVAHVDSARTFRRWKSSFLSRLESFLKQEDIDHAQLAYAAFSDIMRKYIAQTDKVLKYIESGELSVEKLYSAVKPRNALNEWAKMTTQVIGRDEYGLDGLIPSNSHLEKLKKYNKFHMGAVLVRSNFQEYARLTAVGDILRAMREKSLNEVADKQVLTEMDR